jgi:hypothetical protein
MKEEFKQIKNYEGFYEISNLGNVKSLKNNIILKRKGNDSKRSRQYVRLWKNRIDEEYFIDELLLMTFKPHNYVKGTEIWYRDYDKRNITLENIYFKERMNEDYYVYYEIENRGKIKVYSNKTDEIYEMNNAKEFDQTKKIFYLLDSYREDKSNGITEDEFRYMCKEFNTHATQLFKNDIMKINYTNYHGNNNAVSFTYKRLAGKKYEQFKKITYAEHDLFEECFNSGLIKLNKKYKDRFKKCYGYDFTANYPALMSSEQMQIPTGEPKGEIFKKIPKTFKLGIYHCKITSDDENFEYIFCKSQKDYYTNITLNYLLEIKEQFNIKMEMIQDEDYNAFIYDEYITGKEIFGKWYDKIIELKNKFPNNKLIKHISSSLWGHMIHMNKIRAYNDDEIKTYLSDPKYEIHELSLNGKNKYYEFINKENLYTYNMRIKPFVTALGRVNIAKVIVDNIDNFVRACVDGIVLKKQIDHTKYEGLREDDKTTGKICFHNCMRYHKKDNINCSICKEFKN